MGAALACHDAIVRAAIEGHQGYVFSTAGDAFSAAFWRPGDAIAATLDAQRMLQTERWPSGTTVRVRMGVHTGVAQERDGDYFGPALNRAARLMGVAHGGQVLLSLAVEELVRDELADGVRLASLGEHRLRGLSRPEVIFELRTEDLASGFPPLRSSSAGVGNLPRPATSFVGRDRRGETGCGRAAHPAPGDPGRARRGGQDQAGHRDGSDTGRRVSRWHVVRGTGPAG